MAEVKTETTTAGDDKTMAARQQESEENEKDGKEVHEQMTDLTAAKDRAQLTQASAMSILDVKVLADLIRAGSAHSMYVPLLVLVSVALGLQIVVGILSLMVSNIKNRFKKFKSGRGGICCGTCTESEGDDQVESMADDKSAQTTRLEPRKHSVDYGTFSEPNVHPSYGWQPSESGSKNVKAKTVTRLQSWLNQMMDSKETHIESKINVEFLEGEMIRCRQQLESLHAKTDDLDQEEAKVLTKVTKEREKLDAQEQYIKLQQQCRELKAKNDTSRLVVVQGQRDALKPVILLSEGELKHARRRLDEQIAYMIFKQNKHVDDIRGLECGMRVLMRERDELAQEDRQFKIDEGKLKLYQKMAENIEKKLALERITFWQNVINYILYMVFVLNAFIATLSQI